MDTIKETMTYIEFWARIDDVVGDEYVKFQEVGANGWDRLDVNESGPILIHESGPHWIDVSTPPSWKMQHLLLASYDFVTSTATFYKSYVLARKNKECKS